VRRVDAARVLEGVSREEWYDMGRRMARADLFRPYAVEFLRRLRGPEEPALEVHALSANWSKDYLAGALEGLIDEKDIRTNEVLMISYFLFSLIIAHYLLLLLLLLLIICCSFTTTRPPSGPRAG
jgi:hypothetical protein